jgi:thiaminase
MTTLSRRLTDTIARTASGWIELPILVGVRTGTLDTAVFRNYLEQDYLYLRYYGRIYARLAASSVSDEELEHFVALAHGVLGVELEHHRRAAAPFGCRLEEARPSPELARYLEYYESFRDDRAATLVAMLPCTYGYGTALGKINDGGLGPYQEWVDMYASDAYADVMAKHLAMIDLADIDAERAEEIVRRGLELEQAFWAQQPAEAPA